MAKSELSLAVQGVKGGNIKEYPNVGFTCNFVGNDNKIAFDAFEGYGDSYARREETQIRVIKGSNVIFSGTFDELAEIIEKNK
jgi:hypothetical protein